MSIQGKYLSIEACYEILYNFLNHIDFWWGTPGDRVRFSFLGGTCTPGGITRLVEKI